MGWRNISVGENRQAATSIGGALAKAVGVKPMPAVIISNAQCHFIFFTVYMFKPELVEIVRSQRMTCKTSPL